MDERFCPNCGARIDYRMKFCIHCGQKLPPWPFGVPQSDSLSPVYRAPAQTNTPDCLVFAVIAVLAAIPLIGNVFFFFSLIAVVISLLRASQQIKEPRYHQKAQLAILLSILALVGNIATVIIYWLNGDLMALVQIAIVLVGFVLGGLI